MTDLKRLLEKRRITPTNWLKANSLETKEQVSAFLRQESLVAVPELWSSFCELLTVPTVEDEPVVSVPTTPPDDEPAVAETKGTKRKNSVHGKPTED